jgi:hypothetical protein
MRSVCLPLKADAPLIVDADAVLTQSISLQGFQPVSGWDAKIIDSDCSVKLVELSRSHGRNAAPAPALAG